MNVDKYTLYDERGELLDRMAYKGYHQETEEAIDDLTDQIDLLEAVQNYDPRTCPICGNAMSGLTPVCSECITEKKEALNIDNDDPRTAEQQGADAAKAAYCDELATDDLSRAHEYEQNPPSGRMDYAELMRKNAEFHLKEAAYYRNK